MHDSLKTTVLITQKRKSVCVAGDLFVCLCCCLFICLPVCLSLYLFVCLCVGASTSLSVYLFGRQSFQLWLILSVKDNCVDQ